MGNKYSELFTPFKIGNLEIKNRFVMAAMGTHGLHNLDGSYAQSAVEYFIERARQGAGLIICGYTLIESEVQPLVSTGLPDISKNPLNFIESCRYMTERVHAYGCKIFTQLTAGDGRTAPPFELLKTPVAPSPMPNFWDPEINCRELTVEEIKHFVDSFAKAAKVAQEAGFDGVEIHAVHEGYLLDQFTMECFNQRTDQYGGSLENRLRFPNEIVAAIKEACGKDFPVIMRYSVKSYIKELNQGALPGEDFVEIGRDIDEAIEAARILEVAGYDALDCDNGSHDAYYWPHPPVYMPKGCNVPETELVKKAVNIPVIVSGRLEDPDLALEVIKEGKADAIGIGRQFLADPAFVKKIYRNQLEDIRPCIACHLGCYGRSSKGLPICCALNPQVGREKTYSLTPAPQPKNVLVIGGGIAGMEAARVCALRGFNVTLLEKTNQLGGVFIAASAMHFKDNDRKLIDWYRLQMEKLNIDVRLNTEATPEMIDTFSPDYIFVATGSTAKNIEIPGAENCISAIDALLNQDKIGNKVVIIGGGLTGCELAYELSCQGKEVSVIEALDNLMENVNQCFANLQCLTDFLNFHKVGQYTGSTVKEIKDGKVIFEQNGETKELQADTVILSIGYNSDNELFKKIVSKMDPDAEVFLLGDAKDVSNLLGAIWDAYEIARSLE